MVIVKIGNISKINKIFKKIKISFACFLPLLIMIFACKINKNLIGYWKDSIECELFGTQFDFNQYFTLNNSIKKKAYFKDYLCKHIATLAENQSHGQIEIKINRKLNIHFTINQVYVVEVKNRKALNLKLGLEERSQN
ncbi:hypothetical protein BpHYR1_047729 [Brachionus plicatilis]|uniref:Uncharacterized protein n=1 Tax=Brachionus plicatilis TaxID=10195 RepID=A0A3M7P0U9_BRAPC|nr:hypothetical protein BpHYR1_047729 [Brachionus plicatilis]